MKLTIDSLDDLRDYIRAGTDGCWNWLGSINPEGYGRIRVAGRAWKAHRLTYTRLVGPVPDDLVIDHLCRNRACVNPEHMEPVTVGENVRRGLEFHRAARLREIDPKSVELRTGQPKRGVPGTPNSLKTQCPQGHRYDEQNTIVTPAGSRRCRICRTRQLREATRRKRARRLLNGGAR